MTAKSDRLRAHITNLITKDGYARRQAIAIAYDLESKGCLTKDGKVKERCKSKKKSNSSRKRCKHGMKKKSRSCKKKPGPKRSRRKCKRGRRKGTKSCKRKPGPKK
tara:strand:- start:823 stop:1140 length:318 start_codon:yes stop_codon:yes gene_type:complete